MATRLLFDEMISRSPALTAVLDGVRQVAPTDSTVLVTGETGTGKELVATSIHRMSGRRERILVKVNCAALPSGLIESALFGHERGAFTGAVARMSGRFERADGGTIFLDEIGDMPLDLQSKLLRVLQEGEFERVGGTETLRVDARVVAATNRDLRAAVDAHEFREDLYYRLNVFPIELPALRERPEDIPSLVRHFVELYARRLGKRIETISPATLDTLKGYAWPGNVRELQNVLERAVILARGRELVITGCLPKPTMAINGVRVATLEDVQREHILAVLESTAWRIRGRHGAAEILDLKATTLEALMKRLGIGRPGRRAAS